MGAMAAAVGSTRQVEIRPTERYAWYGPAMLVVDEHGECGAPCRPRITGFYVRETRFLSKLRLEVNGEQPWLCAVGGAARNELAFSFVHPEMTGGEGGGSGAAGEELPHDARGLPRRAVDLLVLYRVDFCSLEILLTVTNRWAERASLELGCELDADFADLLEAQSEERQQQADIRREPHQGRLRLEYTHRDLPFATLVTADGGDWVATEDRLHVAVELRRGERRELRIRVAAHDPDEFPEHAGLSARAAAVAGWRTRITRVRSLGEVPFGWMVNQAMGDLGSFALLEGEPAGWLAPAAGAPLYPALFGRDSLTASWQATVLDGGELLDATLHRLQQLQGREVAPARDEEPGRLIHSVRRGPLARLGRNPFARYYGDFASPFMFVISLAQLYAWTGDAERVKRRWDAARRILDWAREYGDRDGDGYLEYFTHAAEGPKNQGWKDSGNAIVHEDGRQVPAPLATCELQGYWFAAQQLMAILSWVLGATEDAKALWAAALDLKERFNRDWWMPDLRFFALALDPDKRPARSITSNVGHCLAAGIIADEHVRPVVGRLFAPDMFSGWGIRTLSTDHPSYNPISYHLGSVWTVENGTIALGLRRYGLDARALDLIEANVALATMYDRYRVPECIGGYARAEFPHPGAYPRANVPQLWNQSVLPLFVQLLLGLQPVAPLDLLVVDPVLPEWLPEITLERLRLGGATATLRFRRNGHGRTEVEVVRKRGTLRVVRQPPLESLSAGLTDRFRALAESLMP